MATSDLANELAKESFRFDSPAAEKQVSEVVLTQLEDSSGDISGLAVKWCVVVGWGGGAGRYGRQSSTNLPLETGRTSVC